MQFAIQTPARNARDDIEISEISERALRFSLEFATPLSPQAYWVWYVYASRGNEAISSAVDKAMNMGLPITRSGMTELYQAHLAERPPTDDLAGYATALAATMAEVSGAVARNLDDGAAAISGLRLIKGSLGLSASRNELLTAVASLMKTNQGQLDAARKLESQLERSKSKISGLEKELAELRKATAVDKLTKLPNRHRFDLLLGEAIFNARQRKSTLSLVIADIDGLGTINEKWGHETGDNVLRFFAGNLVSSLKGKDIIARYGGEEFALLLSDLSLADTQVVAEKLRQAFAGINWTSQQTGDAIGCITASFGGTCLLPGDTRESFTARAERQLQDAKRAGKNQTRTA